MATKHTPTPSAATAPACAQCGDPALRMAPKGSPTVGLIGAPNSGKSTLFNALTGAKVQMGNWPGTSVEISRGRYTINGQTLDMIDFPGAYSLDPATPDEAFTREMIVDSPVPPDAIVIAVDAAAIERGLYMLAQLLERPTRAIVALTKLDVARAHGITVDVAALEQALGVPVIAVNPRKRTGVAEVGQALTRALAAQPQALRSPQGTDELALLDDRFAWVQRAVDAAVTHDDQQRLSTTERIDRVALHPVAGPLLFLAVMWLVFQITTTVAGPIQDAFAAFVDGPVTAAATWLLDAIGFHWSVGRSFILDGLIAGVGAVVSFAPLMALMFICLSVLEDSGYMARAAVVTDRLMKSIGLPGKAFIPIIVGFGCNVPAISATRVLGRPEHRIMTALLIPFASCSARLTVYAMLASTFFPDHVGTVVFAMYVISIALMVATGFALRRTLWRRMGNEPLVIDLPVYQLPGLRLVAAVSWNRLKGFLKTAGGIIVICVAAVFMLQSTPMTNQYSFGDDALPVQDSAYGGVSEAIAPAFEPAGFGSWSLSGALVTGFIAKEAVISTWAQTYALDDPSDESVADQGQSRLAQAIREDFNDASGGHAVAALWAFMIFLLAYTPCVATLAAQRREIGWRWTLAGLGLQLVLAWALAVATFQIVSIWW